MIKVIRRWVRRYVLAYSTAEKYRKALEEIASGKRDMNKLVGIAILALAEDK